MKRKSIAELMSALPNEKKILEKRNDVSKEIEEKTDSVSKSTTSSLTYENSSEDDFMVKSLKGFINNQNVSIDDVYNSMGQSEGYNMIYGLRKRNAISGKVVSRWSEITNSVPMLALIPIDEEEDIKTIEAIIEKYSG